MKERRIKAAVPEEERHNDGDGGCATRSRPAWGRKEGPERRKMKRKVMAALLAAGLAWAPSAVLPVSAAEAWTLPAAGIRMDMQTYMNEKMEAFFHPREGEPRPAAFAPPDGWTWERYSVNGAAAERLVNPDGKTGRVVLQLHGGGYVAPLADGHRTLAVRQAVLANASQVILANYRVAPEHTYPAALDDAKAVYQDILADGTKPENVIVIGDSAGGNLALRLKEEGKPQPGVLILISPWATLANDLPSRSENIPVDPVLALSPIYGSVVSPSYGGALDVKDPRLSPLYADLAGLPPMLIQTGGHELFLDESLALAERAADCDVPVTVSVYQGMPHDFALVLPELQESVDSFRQIRDFVESRMSGGEEA